MKGIASLVAGAGIAFISLGLVYPDDLTTAERNSLRGQFTTNAVRSLAAETASVEFDIESKTWNASVPPIAPPLLDASISEQFEAAQAKRKAEQDAAWKNSITTGVCGMFLAYAGLSMIPKRRVGKKSGPQGAEAHCGV